MIPAGWGFSVWANKDNAGRFEPGCLKVTIEYISSWILPRREKQPKTK